MPIGRVRRSEGLLVGRLPAIFAQMQHKATRSRKTLVERNEVVAWHPPAAVQALAIERRLRRGEILFRSGDRAVGLYAVEEGSIRLSRLDADGHEIVLHSAGPGDLVAEASLFSSHSATFLRRLATRLSSGRRCSCKARPEAFAAAWP